VTQVYAPCPLAKIAVYNGIRRAHYGLGAIAGSAIPLALALTQLWQRGVLVAAAVWLLGLRKGVVSALLAARAAGAALAAFGLPV
jgi:chromate transporter